MVEINDVGIEIKTVNWIVIILESQTVEFEQHTNMESIQVLWVDDEINRLQPHIRFW